MTFLFGVIWGLAVFLNLNRAGMPIFLSMVAAIMFTAWIIRITNRGAKLIGSDYNNSKQNLKGGGLKGNTGMPVRLKPSIRPIIRSVH